MSGACDFPEIDGRLAPALREQAATTRDTLKAGAPIKLGLGSGQEAQASQLRSELWALILRLVVEQMFALLLSTRVDHDSLDDGSIADAIAFGMGNRQSPLKGFKLGRSLTDDLNPDAFKVPWFRERRQK